MIAPLGVALIVVCAWVAGCELIDAVRGARIGPGWLVVAAAGATAGLGSILGWWS